MHSSAGMSADAHPPDVFPRAYDTTSSPGKGSPQRLHQPTPVSSPHRFQQMLPPNEDEAEDKYGTGFQARNYSVSPPKASGMTLAAVAAAAAAASEATYSSAYQAQQSVFQESGQQGTGVTPPVSSEIPQSSSSPKRLFIHPYSRNQVLTAPPNSAPLSNPELTMAPSATSSTSTSLSSAATFSTHDPPTPSTSASVTMMDFIGASKATAVASGAGAFTDYVPQATTDQSMPPQQQPLRIFPRNEQASQVQYENPPQTAPLPARSSSFDEENYSHPPTPATAYPNLHYAQYPMSPALAAAAEHHSQYPGPSSLASAAQFQPELPPPGSFGGHPSAFPNSPFHAARIFPSVNSPEYIGHPQPLPPLRGFSSHPTSAVINSPHQLISPLPTHMSIGLHGHPTPYGPMIPGLHPRPLNLDEEVKNIEAHSGATSFISKLWFLLSQPQEFGEYIRWTVKGKAFILSHNSPTFGEAILSRFFRHSNIASFIRQLNLYKMQRMSQLALLEDLNDSGSKVDGELCHTGFSHPHLQRGHPEMLHMIKPHCPRAKRTKKDVKASEACDDLSPPLSPGRKTRTASCSTGSTVSR